MAPITLGHYANSPTISFTQSPPISPPPSAQSPFGQKPIFWLHYQPKIPIVSF
jgi:hypothetical protein